MKITLKYLSYLSLFLFVLPIHAASVITANNSYVEGYLYVEDIYGNSLTTGGASSAYIDDTEFWDSQGGYFDGYSFPQLNASTGSGGGDQHSVYDVDHFYGDGFAIAEVTDPDSELAFIQVSGQSLVDITFEISTDHTYTLSGDLFADSVGRAMLMFNGDTASELDGAFSFTGLLAAGSYTLSIDALAAIDSAQRNTSRFNYDLQLTEVPLPATVWLFISGLGLLGLRSRL